ncbi:MAG: T9SS type A sorting domain-containing protein [Bacteroidetes bacterium]|nr:T9SS type A sorting domain-containing protein [Bacteroidota bacterium]
MKRFLFFISFCAIISGINAQDTIIGYSFPANAFTSCYPNSGLVVNLNNSLLFENFAIPSFDSITFTNGVSTGDYAATTTKWDNGDTIKAWVIKFKAANYTNFKISSKQRGGGTNAGPKNFQIQWKTETGNWTDVANGLITCGNDWTTGVANQLAVPVSGQGTGYVYIRWLMKGNTDVNGGTVGVAGISKIDDILLTATSTVGVNDNTAKSDVSLYPNPCNGKFTINAVKAVKEISVYNIIGKQILTENTFSSYLSIDLTSFGKGIYFVKLRYNDNSFYTEKILVR